MQMHITLFIKSSYTCSSGVTSNRAIGGQRAYPVSVDFSRYRALQKLNRNDQPAFPLYLVQNPLHPSQGSTFDQHPVAQFQERPRHHEQSGLYHLPYIFNFVIGYRRRNLSETHQVNHSGGRQYGQPIRGIQPAKHVTGKEKLVNFLRSIRPIALGLPSGRELLVSAFSQVRRGDSLMVGANSYSKPRVVNNIRSDFFLVKHYLRDHGSFVSGWNKAFSC